MADVETKGSTVSVRVRNVGGISETDIDIPPGVTVLEGRNATNRTSFLQGILAGMGSDDVTLKGDSDEGRVEITIGGTTYRRTLRRSDGTVTLSGEPYLDDSTTAELFAFLLESNEARQAVVRGDDLRDLIMRPIDTDEIEAEIDRLERERSEVDEELERLDSLKDELPSLERRKRELEAEIEDTRDALDEKEAEIESIDADVSETRDEKQELESRLDELRELRSELERVRSDIDRQEESIGALRSERSELQAERESLPETPMGDHEHLEEEIAELRDRKQSLEAEVSDLQGVIQFNEEMLDGEETTVRGVLGGNGASAGAVTDRLVEDEPVVCWTCGSEVERDRIVDTVEELRSVRKEYLDDIRELESDLEDHRTERREREQRQQRLETVDRKLTDVEEELDRRQSRLDDLRERRDDLQGDIETTEREVEALESENFSEVLDLHREANQLEFELGGLESDLDDVTDRMGTLEDRIAEESDLRGRREGLEEELETQRTRIDRIEQQAVEAFNTHMAEIIDLLEYDNLARIWLERVQKRVREGRRKVDRSVFELHVVRTADSGATYEDTVAHLSESEREVTGLVFALAGYLVHDVHETVPFMVLDSLEALDAERLAELIPYFADYAEYLVVALLPEDAQFLPDEYNRVTSLFG